MTGTTEGSTESCFYGEAGNRTCNPWFTTFCGFPWVETSTAGRVYDLCVYYMTGAPEGSPKVVLCGIMGFFMEKPGIEPATPGLQGIALIHYTTGASLRDSAYPLHVFVTLPTPRADMNQSQGRLRPSLLL